MLDIYFKATFTEVYHLSPETVRAAAQQAGTPNQQVIMEILGVVNNPIMELQLGEEKLFLEE